MEVRVVVGLRGHGRGHVLDMERVEGVDDTGDAGLRELNFEAGGGDRRLGVEVAVEVEVEGSVVGMNSITYCRLGLILIGRKEIMN